MYVCMYILSIAITGNGAVVAIVVVIVILILCGCIIMDILFCYCSKRKEQHDQDNGVYLLITFNTYVYIHTYPCTYVRMYVHTYVCVLHVCLCTAHVRIQYMPLNFCFAVHVYVRT